MTNKNKKQDPAGNITELFASGSVLSRWLGISGKSVYELAKAGILVRVGRDQFLLEESVRRYCDHIRQSASQGGGASVRGEDVYGETDPAGP